jgi:recombinational DNA repair protein RecR
VNKIFKIQEKIINLIYPQTCGICGKINNKTVCSKCNIQLKKQEKIGILTKEKLES